MKIASWNVNSIRARLERVTAWVEAQKPDILCLQETKADDESFPVGLFHDLGYHAALYGQRTYNGVAIVAREPIRDIVRGFGDGDADEEARFIHARVGDLEVASVYVPNGKVVGSDKFAYKLRWLDRLQRWLDAEGRLDVQRPLALCGDYNIAPHDRDVHDPEAFAEQVLCHPEERARFAALERRGLRDLFATLHPEGGYYSWWDYRMLGFPKNHGLRIDHILATPVLALRLEQIYVDREARKGKEPSDHAPLVAELV